MDFISTVIEDAAVLEPSLHKDYRSELLAYVEPGEEVFLLMRGIDTAINAYTLWDGVVLLAIFGYYSDGGMLSGDIYPWALWSNEIIRLPRVHVNVMRALTDILVEDCGVIRNTIRKDNLRGQKFLRLIGCEVSHDTWGISPTGVELVEYRKVA